MERMCARRRPPGDEELREPERGTTQIDVDLLRAGVHAVALEEQDVERAKDGMLARFEIGGDEALRVKVESTASSRSVWRARARRFSTAASPA